MEGRLLVDGVDVYVAYGVYIGADGYNGLLGFAPLKEPYRNDWAEYDGIDVDLTDPKLDTKQFAIHFGANDYLANVGGFIAMLSTGVYHDFQFLAFGMLKTLRIVGNSAYTGLMRDIRTFTLEFADDFPLNITVSNPTPASTVSNSCVPQGFKIDGKELSDYGITVLEGITAEIMKAPQTKQNMLVNVKNKSGVIYGGTTTKFQDKEVKLKCVLIIDTMAHFLTNYNALLYNLIRPNERAFTSTMFHGSYPLYYKSATVEKFHIGSDYVWCEFTLTFCCTSSRPTLDFIEIFALAFDHTFNRLN